MTQDYRNWYTYYRTRMLMMRTATSLAFKGIDDKYRVGFSTISSTTVDGSLFLDVADFDATQKAPGTRACSTRRPPVIRRCAVRCPRPDTTSPSAAS